MLKSAQLPRPPAIILIAMLLSALYGWAIFVTTFRYPGLIGPNYNTPGTDYMVFHGGIATALRGDWRLLFDPDRFTAYLNTRYHDRLDFPLTYRPWVYPPSFLPLLLPFAPLGFLASYLVYQIATACGLVAAICTRAHRPRASWALAACALAAPAASVNVLWGQGAFLTAALLIGGTRLLQRHQILAGVLFGLMSVKPQHALLVPVMLLALRAWPALMAAALTSLGLAILSVAIFGTESWRLWAETARRFAADVPLWDSSLHTCAVLLGAGAGLANIVMAAALAGMAVVVYRAFRSNRSPRIRLAILLAAANIAAPHTGPYDTLLLVLAAGLILADSRIVRPMLVWTLGIAVWLLPLFGQPLVSPIARFAPLLTIGLLAWIWTQRPADSATIAP